MCRWSVERLDVPRTVRVRSVMGTGAFALLMVAEVALAVLVFRRSPAEQLRAYMMLGGAIGLVAQVIFPLVPISQVWR